MPSRGIGRIESGELFQPAFGNIGTLIIDGYLRSNPKDINIRTKVDGEPKLFDDGADISLSRRKCCQ